MEKDNDRPLPRNPDVGKWIAVEKTDGSTEEIGSARRKAEEPASPSAKFY